MSHRRSKSFSDSLVLEDVEKGGVIVKSIRPDSSSEIGVKEGDEIVGATINFDKFKKDEVLKVLKLIEPYNGNLKVLTKKDLKDSDNSGTLNNRIASPKEMLKDSYSRLFHSKVQRFLNREQFLCDAAKTSDAKIDDLNSHLLIPGERLYSNGVNFKDDIEDPTNLSNMSTQTPEFSKRGPSPPMGLSSKLKESEVGDIVKCPEVNLSGLKSKYQDRDLNLKMDNITGGNINVSAIDWSDDSFNGTQGPKPDLNLPDVHLTSPLKKCSHPTLPTFRIAGPKVKFPELGIDGNLETTDLNFSAPKIEGKMNDPGLGVDLLKADFQSPKLDMKTQDLDMDVPSGKLIMPKSGAKLKGPDVIMDAGSKTPDLKIKASKVKGEIKAPNIGLNEASADMKGSELNADVSDVDVKSLSLQFPTMPKFGLSGTKMKCPEVDIDGDLETPDLNLLAPKIKGELNASELSVDLPKAEINSPKIDMKTPLDIDAPSGKFTMPKFSLSGPKVKGPDFDIDADLKTHDLNLNGAKIKGGIKGTDTALNLPSAVMKANKHNVDIPDINMKSPPRKFKFPTLPKFGISDLKIKRPEMDIDGDQETPDLNLSAPKIKQEINALESGVDLPKAEFNSLKIDMKTPHLDTDAPSGKFSMPKFSLSGPKVKGPDFDIDADLKTPDLNLNFPNINRGIKGTDTGLNLPSADMKANKYNVDIGDIDMKSPSRKFKFPTLPKFGISGHKVKCPEMGTDGDLETPDLSFSAPKAKGKISAPQFGVDLPKADFNIPERDMKMPDLGIVAPPGKFTMPKFSLSGSKVKAPEFDVDADLKIPELNLTSPKVKGGMKTPELDVDLPRGGMKGPNFDLKIPNFDLKSPSKQFKFPKLPKLGISESKVKGPQVNIDGHLKTADLNLSAPKIKGVLNSPEFGADLPKADFNMPMIDMRTPDSCIDVPSGKFTMPKFNLSGPKVKGPDFNIDEGLKTPELNLNVPKMMGGMKNPELDVDLPRGDMKGPKFDLKIPNFDLKSPSEQFTFPKLPKLGISGPKVKGPQVDIDGDLKTPDLNLSAPKIKGKINVPEFGVDLPKADFNMPTIDMSTPDSGIDVPSGKFTMPKLNLSGPKVKGPDFDIDAGLKTPELNLNAPKIKGRMKTPELDVDLPRGEKKGPKFDLKIPNFDLKSPSQKFKFPKLPKLGISGSKVKGPQVDIGGDLKTPDLNLSAPKIKGEMNAPEFGVDLPKADFNIPNLDIKTPDSGIDAPSGKFTLPKFNLSGNKMKAPDFDIDADLKTPELNLPAPKVKGRMKIPELDVDLPRGDKKGLNIPNIDQKSPSRQFKFPKLPKGEINAPELSAELPKADFNIPKRDTEASYLDLDAPSGKFTMPKLNLSGSNVNSPDFDIDAGLKAPDLNLAARTVKGRIKTPKVDVSLPSDNMKGPKLDLKASNFDMKSCKVIDEISSSDVIQNSPQTDKKSTLKMNTPQLDLDAPLGICNMPAPRKSKYGLSGLNMKREQLDIDAVFNEANPSASKMKSAIHTHDGALCFPRNDTKNTQLNSEASNYGVSVLSGKIKMPTMKMKSGSSGPCIKEKDLDASLKTQDVFPLNSKDKAGLITSGTSVNSPKVDLNGHVDPRIQNPNLKNPSVVGYANLFKGEGYNKGYNLPNTEVPKFKTSIHKVNTNILCAPNIDLEVSGGTLKRSKLKLQKTFL